jgi:hypothetical protein
MKYKGKLMIVVLCALPIILGFWQISEGCTLVGATGKATKDGKVYVASTSDNAYIRGPRKPIYVGIPEKGYKFVATPCIVQDPPGNYFDVGSDRFMNEKGFSCTRAWVDPDEPIASNAISRIDWFIKMATTVATVEEAIKYAKETPKGVGANGNYIFADADGNLAVVEVGFQTVHVAGRWSKNDMGICARANRYETDKMKPLDATTKVNPLYNETSPYRYEQAMKLLNDFSGKIDLSIMKSIVGDNKHREYPPTTIHGRSISSHGRERGTVSAEVYDPANLTFWYTYGWPDGDHKSSNIASDGANKNTWGAWIPFILPKLKEQGFYTDWNGYITPMGARYLSTLIGE